MYAKIKEECLLTLCKSSKDKGNAKYIASAVEYKNYFIKTSQNNLDFKVKKFWKNQRQEEE